MRSRVILLVAALVAVTFTGCIAAETPDGVDTASLLPFDATPFAGYLHNLSVPLDGVDVFNSIQEQLPVVVDGIILDTWIVRPDIEGPVPLVLEVTPYYGGGAPVIAEAGINSLGKLASVLVPRGYAVGLSSVRGTGNSEGCFTMGGPQEAKDTAAVIESLAAQSWSNGKVGLIGVSYPGTTPQDVWVEAPPSLKTIVPISGISDLYKYNFVNGVPIDVQGYGFNTYYWAMVGLAPAGLSGGAQALDPQSMPGAVAGEACTDQLDVQEGGVSSTLDGNKDAYWQARDFLAELNAAPDVERASVFYIHGLQDWNVKTHNMEGWLDALWDTGVPMKVWLGQWGHAWPDRNDWWEGALVAWFDQFLKDVDTGILDAPRVQVQSDDGDWRHDDIWPPRLVESLVLHPDAAGALNPTPGDGTASYHDYNGGAVSHAAPVTPPVVGRVESQGLRGEERVVFVSEPLERTVVFSGMPRFEGNVTASGQRASLIFTLAERAPSGEDRAFNFAAQSLNHVDSLEKGVADISGRTQFVSLNFFPQEDVVHAGNRIVLIAAGNVWGGNQPGPSLLPASDGSVITLDLAGATLSLPYKPGILVYESPQPYDED